MTDSAPLPDGHTERYRSHVAPALRIRFIVLTVVFVVMAAFVAVDTVRLAPRSVVPVLGFAVVGLVVGVLGSRMFRLTWDRASARVVSRVDAVGVAVLLAYVLVMVFRGTLVGLWVEAAVAGVAGLALTCGALAGQVIGTRRGLAHLFRTLAARPHE